MAWIFHRFFNEEVKKKIGRSFPQAKRAWIFHPFFNEKVKKKVFFLPGGTPGGAPILEAPKLGFLSIFDRFLIDLGPLLGPKLALCWRPWSVLGRLGRSQGGLCGLRNPFFSPPMSNSNSDPVLHRFRTPNRPQKSLKNQSKTMPEIKLLTSPILALSSIKF